MLNKLSPSLVAICDDFEHSSNVDRVPPGLTEEGSGGRRAITGSARAQGRGAGLNSSQRG